MRRKTSLLDVCVLLLCLLLPGYAMAITRDEIIATCAEYAELSYNVDSTNVYPWNRHQGVACYWAGCENTVAIGSQIGMPYSYGAWTLADLLQSELDEGRGAGNKKCLYDANESCVWNHMTGIDCSGLVSRAWGLWPRRSTEDLPSDSDTIQVSELRGGDVLNWYSQHVIVFEEWRTATTAWVYESAQGPGRVVHHAIVVEDKVDSGYVPLIYHALVDSPAATLLVVGSDSSGRVEWETGWERNTEGFVVHRRTPAGSWEPVSGLIPGTGSVEEGDRYSFVDGGFLGPQTMYRLQEVETSGSTIWLGRTSAADGIPSVPLAPLPGHPIREAWAGKTGASGGCPITDNPENRNLDWIAVCPEEWEDEVSPLVAHRQSEGFVAGTWSFDEVNSCYGSINPPFVCGRCLRDLLADALAEWTVKPKYVLLVGDAYYEGGDADLIPMWGSYDPEISWVDEDSIWSDRPYADPDSDGVIEIFVGRVPAKNETDVANAVAKIIERDNAPDATYGKRSLVFVEDSGDCGNDSAWIREPADSVNSSLPTDWSRTLIAQSAIGGTYYDWERVADSAWSAGQGLVFFFGNCSGWWSFNNFMNTAMWWSADMIEANHQYPFVFGGSCGEGGVDRADLWGVNRPVLEQLLCSHPDRGASGGLAPTRSLHSYTAAQIAGHLIDRIFRGEPTLGAAAYHGMDDLLETDPGARDHVWEYVFFGDPAMRSLAPDGTGIAEHEGALTFALGLEVPSPHPITGCGAIRFSLPASANADLKIYDIAGRAVKTLVSGRMEAGTHTIEWDRTNDRGREVASGIYFLRLRLDDRAIVRKVTVLR